VRINGGYFVLRKEVFDFMEEGEELVSEPFNRMIAAEKLYAHNYDGFWTCIDTFKEKQELDEMWARGNTPWQVWSPETHSKAIVIR
jgi:glucose-1-phosphate cytidylyltransferase